MVGSEEWLGGVYYVFNLVRALSTLQQNERPELILLVSRNTKPEHVGEIDRLVEEVVTVDSRKPIARAILRKVLGLLTGNANYALARTATSRRIDVLFPVMYSLDANFPAGWIGWIPDFQHKYLPDFFTEQEITNRNKVFREIANNADLVILSSVDAKTDFGRLYPEHVKKAGVLSFPTVPPEGWWAHSPEHVCGKLGLPGKYLCVSNQFWVHKNHKVLFDALKTVADTGLEVPVVCTGAPHDYRDPGHFDRLKNLVLEKRLTRLVHFLGLLPRVEQIQVMRGAAAIVQPSLFEGWSTVVEDARLLGKIVILSNLPVHLEQSPPGAIYFDPHNASELANIIVRVWPELKGGHDADTEWAARQHGRERVSAYARRFVEIVKSCAAKGPLGRQVRFR